MDINQIKVASSNTHHLYNEKPFYAKRFHQVLKFHEPGLAPCLDKTGAYHMDLEGQPAYLKRYEKTVGFYQGYASVKTENGWCHIKTNGEPLYTSRYRWCGNFQQGYCVVEDQERRFFHIGKQGLPLYDERYNYVGDFRDGIAVVQNQQGYYSHINPQGELIHQQWFLDLDVFHKGFARAKDQRGWHHISVNGEPIYQQRYAMIEPFYNGIARCETKQGAMVRIDESGYQIEVLRDSLVSEFQSLSADLVGYWKTQTINAAIHFNIFDYLPADLDSLSDKTTLSRENTRRLVRALQELQLVDCQNDLIVLTERAQYLTAKHPLSLKSAVPHWADAHYRAWQKLPEALQTESGCYEQLFQKPLFDWLDDSAHRLKQYQNAMTAYALHDYEKLSGLIPIKGHQTVIDAAGGEGSLLKFMLKKNSHATGILLERASVISTIAIPPELKNRMQVQSFDLMQAWPETADVITMSRVLHDWDDATCDDILIQARNALNPQGRLYIIEFLLDESSSGSGGMLDLNMLVITGGKERSLAEFIELGGRAGLAFITKQTQGNYHILEFRADNV